MTLFLEQSLPQYLPRYNTVFDYILVIPVVALSFVVLIYGLVLSLEQRRREVAIHRVIGGTEAALSRMMILEVYAISSIAWVLGFV